MKKRILCILLFCILSVNFLSVKISAYEASVITIPVKEAFYIENGVAVKDGGVISSEGKPLFLTFDVGDYAGDIKSAMVVVRPLTQDLPVASTIFFAEYVPESVALPEIKDIIFERTINTYSRNLVYDVSEYVRKLDASSLTFAIITDEQVEYSNLGSELSPVLRITTGNSIITGHMRENFESGNLDKWADIETALPENVQIVPSPTEPDNLVLKTRLSRSDGIVAGSKRTEVKKEGAGVLGAQMWYSFDIFVPDDYVFDTTYEVVAQWHIGPDDTLGEIWRSPPLSLRTFGSDWCISIRSDPKPLTIENDPRPEGTVIDRRPIAKIERGKWVSWVFHVKWSCHSDGILEIWKDNVNIFNRYDSNMYNDQSSLFMKVGIYKPPYTSETNYGVTEYRELYYDNVNIFYNDDAIRGVLTTDWQLDINDLDYTNNLFNITSNIQNYSGEPFNSGFVSAVVSNNYSKGMDAKIIIETISPVSGEVVNKSTVFKRINPLKDENFGMYFRNSALENYIIRIYVEYNGLILSDILTNQ